MASTSKVARRLAGHQLHIASILDILRRDRSLDDAQKGRRITQVIAAGNVRTVKILMRHGKLPPSP